MYVYDEKTVESYAPEHLELSATAYDPNAVSAPSVSGKVVSYNPGNATTIQLMQGGKEQYKTTIAADTGSGQKEQTLLQKGTCR